MNRITPDHRDWIRVDLKCPDCAAELPLYHDGESAQSVTIICTCGGRAEWSFASCKADRRYGFGMTSPTPGPLALVSIVGRMNKRP